MRGYLGGIARSLACAVTIGWLGAGEFAPSMAQQTPRQPQPQQQAKPFDVCKGMTGADAPTKLAACTVAIKDGKLAPNDLALAYLNRGLSESGPGSDARSKDDYKAAIRIYNELILASPMNPYYYTQRGVIYQTIGEADRAILDYSDAIRLAPRETYPLINRGVLLYLRKDNNEGAIADLTAALKIKPCEVSAWANRGIVYRRKGEIDRAITDFSDGIKCLPSKIEPIRQHLVSDAVTSQLSAQQDQNTLVLQAAFIHFQRGLAYYDKLQYDKAIADFSEAIRLNPLDASAYVGRGAAYLNKDEPHKAIADFSEAIKLSPGQAFAHLQRGIAYHRVGEADKALEDYGEAIKLTPKDPTPYVNRGIVYYTKKGQYEAAITDFSRALELNPKEVNALINRGITYRQRGETDRALADFGEAIRQGTRTSDLLRLASQAERGRDPELARTADQVAHAYYQRGMARIDKQDYEGALDDFNLSMRINPREPRAYLGRGAANLKKGDHKQAVGDLDEAIKLAPGLAFAYFERGTAYHAIDDFQHAIADYSEAIRLDPKDPITFINRGMALTYVDKIDEALADFDTALHLSPENVNAYIHRAFAYALKREFARAMGDIDEAVRLAPTSATAYFYRAQILAFQGDTERAIADYDRSIKLDPKNARVYGNQAMLYNSIGDYGNAVANLDQAIRLRPREAVFYLNRGVAHFGLGQYANAIADYDEVLKLDPRSGAAYNNRCLSRAVLGQDYPKAIADCTEALRLQPNDPYAHDNLGIIYLKQGDYAKAIVEFNGSLGIDASRARALYGRGLAKTKSGDAAGGRRRCGAGRPTSRGPAPSRWASPMSSRATAFAERRTGRGARH